MLAGPAAADWSRADAATNCGNCLAEAAELLPAAQQAPTLTEATSCYRAALSLEEDALVCAAPLTTDVPWSRTGCSPLLLCCAVDLPPVLLFPSLHSALGQPRTALPPHDRRRSHYDLPVLAREGPCMCMRAWPMGSHTVIPRRRVGLTLGEWHRRWCVSSRYGSAVLHSNDSVRQPCYAPFLQFQDTVN